MPKGPRGEKRPADVIGAAVMVAKVATGEITEHPQKESPAALLGRAGGKARAKKLSPQQRRRISFYGPDSSMRAISRVCDVSLNTVDKLLVDAGDACAAFHAANVVGGES